MEGLRNGVFITFSGNCRKALTFYQACFGGTLHFEMLENNICGTVDVPVVSASLNAPDILIYGSDLVHDEGRRIGNYVAVFLKCTNIAHRNRLVRKLVAGRLSSVIRNNKEDKLIEVADVFDVRWILGI